MSDGHIEQHPSGSYRVHVIVDGSGSHAEGSEILEERAIGLEPTTFSLGS